DRAAANWGGVGGDDLGEAIGQRRVAWVKRQKAAHRSGEILDIVGLVTLAPSRIGGAAFAVTFRRSLGLQLRHDSLDRGGRSPQPFGKHAATALFGDQPVVP